jgi:hypothetical protein
MMRALPAFFIIFALLLVYPSADLLAKSPAVSDSPSIQIISPRGGMPLPKDMIGYSDGEDDDSGDADDLAGYRSKYRYIGNAPGQDIGRARLVLKIWWMFGFFKLF